MTSVKTPFGGAMRLDANLAIVDGGAENLAVAGLPGVTVSISSLTEFKGGISSLAGVDSSRQR